MLAGRGNGHVLRSEGSHQRAQPAALGAAPRLVARVVTGCSRTDWAPSATQAYAAVVRREAVVRTRPSAGAHVVGRFTRLDQNGYPTVLGVLAAHVRGCRPLWFSVQVPSPPNGTSGWVRASDVRVFPVSSRIEVDLSSRRVSVYRWGKLALTARVAIGAPGTPTPTGRYFVDERFLLSSADGPFGVAALGISAHSSVLHDWVQDGPIALHGTNEPAMIGRAVSHGCIRLRNAAMTRLFRLAPAGTPVLITP